MIKPFEELDKPEQKRHLIMLFGIMIAPARELAQATTPPNLMDYRQLFARMAGTEGSWNGVVRTFTTFKDAYFDDTSSQLSGLNTLSGFLSDIQNIVNRPPADLDLTALQLQFETALDELYQQFFKLIEQIPIDWQATLSEANTPLTVYMRISDAIAGARRRLDYFDRYLREDFYDLYLRHLDRNLAVRLVTLEGSKNGRKSSGALAVTPISDLTRQEFKNYKLVQVMPKDMHGRILRVDDTIFYLDASVSDAGRYPTHFAHGDSRPAAHQALDKIIDQGTVIHSS